ncbi:hypothetical protein, partial [[Clostridium] aminophilum]|uniref:hypothetical protein n=1 Tax=[Clostridium] aminophilum TaxID=1526 RepID=UPI00332602A3
MRQKTRKPPMFLADWPRTPKQPMALADWPQKHKQQNCRFDMLPPSRTLKYKTYLGVFMSRKSKIDPTEKVKIVERLLADEISVSEA